MTAALSLVLQAIAVLAIGAIFATVARRPSMRHAFWTGAVVGSLLLPAAALVLPTIRVTEPEFIRATIESVAPERVVPTTPLSQPAIDPLSDLRLETERPAAFDWKLILSVLWALGTVGSLIQVFRRALRVRALVSATRPVTSRAVLAEWERLLDRFSIDRARVALLETRQIVAPATGGLLRAHVLLPAGSDAWSRDRVRVVLAHELAHVVRRDCLTQTAAQFASALYWFSPLHRYAERMMAVERERACDEFVLRAGLPARSYALALIDAKRDAVSFHASESLLLAMAAPNQSELEHRVEHILDGSAPDRAMGPGARVAVVSLAVAVVVVTSSVRLEAASPQNVFGAGSQQGIEPDRRRDSTALPASERVPGGTVPSDDVVRAVLAGPDSMLATHLVQAMAREPRGDADLVRERARWAVMQSVDGRLVEPLIARLDDPDWRVRAYAAWALGVAQDSRATAALVAQMAHPVWRMRAMAASALQSIGDIRARDVMLRALADDAWQVRAPAVTYLGALHDAELTPVIRARLSDRHMAVRIAAARALEQ
jgi:beta-lactamase regulating signal transducer with metallopeptidase domain